MSPVNIRDYQLSKLETKSKNFLRGIWWLYIGTQIDPISYWNVEFFQAFETFLESALTV
jgi:hypothetical protein